MSDLRTIYAQKAMEQIPRLLGNMDRNSYSPSYGCFHRDYWLDKTSDFPDAVRQFGVHALALVYRHDFPDNPYKGQPKIREWTLAAMRFWCSIQHADGSFDEFYPYERGWVGPTAFTTYTMAEAYLLMQDEMAAEDQSLVASAISKAAYFIGKGEAEADYLANHHAMACLSLRKAYDVLQDPEIMRFYEQAWKTFLTYHKADEGWSVEYDGIDPGYLSATVSFLGKIYKDHPQEELLQVIRESVRTSSYFAYPNGHYAGSTGSRNTLHFYPHGYEITGRQIPEAAAVAEKMLQGLQQGALAPPGIISDRYVFYRVPEFLLAYLDYTERPETLPKLPWENDQLQQFFPQAGIYAMTREQYYLLANLAKGGVIKLFDRHSGQLLANDAGIIGQLESGKTITSQWIDPRHQITQNERQLSVSGYMQEVPSHKLFTPFKLILFRSALVALGWIPAFAHFLKGQIRKALILGQRQSRVRFTRTINLNTLEAEDTLTIEDGSRFTSLSIGDEFFVRYVPQSRYFQPQELQVKGYEMPGEALQEGNRQGAFTYKRRLVPASTQ